MASAPQPSLDPTASATSTPVKDRAQPAVFTPLAEAAVTPMHRRISALNMEEAFHEARTTSWGSTHHEELEQLQSLAASPSKTSLRHLERHVVYLRAASGNYCPYIMHTVEIHPSIALVIISEGVGHAMCDLMHAALRSVTRILEINEERERDEEIKQCLQAHDVHHFMAVRGSAMQAASDALINGNYFPMEGVENGNRPCFEKSTKDLYLFYYPLYHAWCITPEVNNVNVIYAMAEDVAQSPEAIRATWETYDFDIHKHVSAPAMRIRCVRNDGAVRNPDGRWARLAQNGLFYCGGAATCRCGTCNGVCGPRDGCNCDCCKQLGGTVGFGETTAPPQSGDEMRLVREQALRRELEPLRSAVLQMLVRGNTKLEAWHDKLRVSLNNVVNAIGGPNGVNWSWFPSAAGGLFTALNNGVGGFILEQNNSGASKEEVAKAEVILKDVQERLTGYWEYLSTKIKCNIPYTMFVERFPALLHFLYVNRATDALVAPELIPFPRRPGEGLDVDPTRHPTMKRLVWRLHEIAMSYLAQGYTTMMRRCGDFTLSYFLWFEDQAGNRLTTTGGPVPPLMEGGGFYRALTASWFPAARPHSVLCYELLLIHFSVVPLDFVAAQGQAFVKFVRDTLDG